MTTDLKSLMEEAPEWQDRDGYTPIPPEQWGRDHFNLLLLVEDRAVNHRGLLEWDTVGISQRHWPMLSGAQRRLSAFGGQREERSEKYPIRLTGHSTESPNERYGICEVDCLIDMREAGWLTITMPVADRENDVWLAPSGRPIPEEDVDFVPSEGVTGLVEWGLMPWARFALTERGSEVAAALRAHRASHKPTTTFTLDLVPASS